MNDFRLYILIDSGISIYSRLMKPQCLADLACGIPHTMRSCIDSIELTRIVKNSKD
jgi:hypothetical protein